MSITSQAQQQNNKKKYYRPDIDGLRALAVIPVIFFHLKISGFSGGFVGVDIFFVISGYLITSIILKELNEDRFSLINFWERRVRRILPVLFFVLMVTTVASYFVTLFPPDFAKYGQSLAAQALFIVNIFFMRIGDYFADPAETITLLHTWSLAVEEQFYILFPILLILIYKISKKILPTILITVGTLSLLYSIYLVNINPTDAFSIPYIPHIWGGADNAGAGFYFPLARAWELIAGSLIAIFAFRIKNNSLAEILSFIGVALIVLTIALLTDKNAFPGLAALAPVLGTMAIIVGNTGHDTFVSKILSFPALVWIGLISYSLYLWHWPLIVLTGQYLNEPLSPIATGLIFISTFILSIASYFLIETPFRKKSVLAKRWQIFCFGLFAIITLVSAGVFITIKDGLPDRAPEAARAIAVAAADTNPREYECFRNNYRQIFGEIKLCTIGDESLEIKPTFVLWGDSHSNAIMPAFDAIAYEKQITGTFFAAGGCPPLVVGSQIRKNPQCTEKGQMALDYINDNDIEKVFLVSSWHDNYPHYNEDGNHTILEALTATIDQIPTTTEIIIMQRVPYQPEFHVRELFYTAIKTKSVPDIYIQKNDHTDFTQRSQEAIKKLASEKRNIKIIDPTDIFCSDTECSITHNSSIIYSDGNHLNTTGVLMMMPMIEDVI